MIDESDGLNICAWRSFMKSFKNLRFHFFVFQGVMIYVMFEMMVWLFLAYVAIDNESEFFHNYDLYKFEEHIEDNWLVPWGFVN